VRQTTEIQTVSHGIFFPHSLYFATNCDAINVLETRIVITENGVRLRLNIVDTPGYGDQVNNENW
jgi:septin family protein